MFFLIPLPKKHVYSCGICLGSNDACQKDGRYVFNFLGSRLPITFNGCAPFDGLLSGCQATLKSGLASSGPALEQLMGLQVSSAQSRTTLQLFLGSLESSNPFLDLRCT